MYSAPTTNICFESNLESQVQLSYYPSGINTVIVKMNGGIALLLWHHTYVYSVLSIYQVYGGVVYTVSRASQSQSRTRRSESVVRPVQDRVAHLLFFLRLLRAVLRTVLIGDIFAPPDVIDL